MQGVFVERAQCRTIPYSFHFDVLCFLCSVVHRRCFSESCGFLVLVSRSLAFSVASVASGGSRHGARGAASGESAFPWFDLWPV